LLSRSHRHILLMAIVTVLLTAALSPAAACSGEPAALSVFAAAGAKPAIDEICRQFHDSYGIRVEVTYGGGGEVLSQMTLAKSGDLYIAPEQSFMEKAVEKQAIDPATVTSVAYLIPVITVPKGNPGNIQSLADLARPGIEVAVTRPETTLLGKYAPEIFAKAGLAEEIGKNIVTEAARPDNLLTMLIMEQVDAGILWHFYAVQNEDTIENIRLLPEQLTGIGEMQIAVTAYCQDTDAAREFIDFITSAAGKDVFQQLGYLVDPEEVEEYQP
jgi:molybdate transport system substrate-binding protein